MSSRLTQGFPPLYSNTLTLLGCGVGRLAVITKLVFNYNYLCIFGGTLPFKKEQQQIANRLLNSLQTIQYIRKTNKNFTKQPKLWLLGTPIRPCYIGAQNV